MGARRHAVDAKYLPYFLQSVHFAVVCVFITFSRFLDIFVSFSLVAFFVC